MQVEDKLKEVLCYDETSPTGLRWKVDRFKGVNHSTKMVSAGDVAGSKAVRGYWQVKVFGGERINDYHLTLAEKQVAKGKDNA